MRNHKAIANKARYGFTMVELLEVLVILGLLAGVVAVNVVGKIDRPRVTATRTNLRMLHSAVTQFKLDTGRFPNEEEGLLELLEEPGDVIGWDPSGYLDTTDLPLDAWSSEFFYERFPESGKPFVIISFGADGEEGGEDYDADLYSTDAN